MICEDCKPEFDRLIKRIEILERRLAVYENANTPSSKTRFQNIYKKRNIAISREKCQIKNSN